jgi:class 3 adenylate cyclase/ribosomal protein L40E
MKCPQCGQDNPPQAKFCEECATPLARRCASCGAQLSPRAKFCSECATPVAIADARPAPASYTPKHLAERILTSKAALEGERKQVTVLFVDLKGSMELLADRDPQGARKILDPVLERMMEAVHRYEGTVNQVMGDGIMAQFGAPLAHEDHAVRACYAALRIQESVKKYAEEVRRSHAAVIKIRVGLNSGEVVVRSIGSDLHMDYTAVGQTTHLAARMEQMAEPADLQRPRTRSAPNPGRVDGRWPTSLHATSYRERIGVTGERRRRPWQPCPETATQGRESRRWQILASFARRSFISLRSPRGWPSTGRGRAPCYPVC